MQSRPVVADSPSLSLGVCAAAGSLRVRHLPVAYLPAVAQSLDPLAQVRVAADQYAAGQRRGRPAHARERRQHVQRRRPSSPVVGRDPGCCPGSPSTLGAPARRLGGDGGAAEDRRTAAGRRELALVPATGDRARMMPRRVPKSV